MTKKPGSRVAPPSRKGRKYKVKMWAVVHRESDPYNRKVCTPDLHWTKERAKAEENERFETIRVEVREL